MSESDFGVSAFLDQLAPSDHRDRAEQAESDLNAGPMDDALQLPDGLIKALSSSDSASEESAAAPSLETPHPKSKAFDRLAKILAQAENTDNDEERQIFMDEALRRAAQLGVDLEMARAHHRDKTKREVPEERRFEVGVWGGKYNAHYVELFTDIAFAHDVRCTISSRNFFVWGYGLPSDLDIVEALFGICSIQMVSDASAALKRGEQRQVSDSRLRMNPHTRRYEEVPGVDGRIFRANFYNGYRDRLNARLWNARNRAMTQADEKARETGDDSPGAALVLRDKKREVDEFYDEKHAHMELIDHKDTTRRVDYIPEARVAGAESAARTDLSLAIKVGGHNKKELT